MKNNYLLLTFTLLSIFISCQLNAQQTSHTVTIGAVQRNYIKFLPNGLSASESPSLVFVLHGLGDSNLNMASGGFNLIADTARCVVIYPQGLTNSWGQSSWNNGTLLASTANDIGLFNTLLDEMIETYNVDPSRVYCTGFSMGSIMTYHVACLMNDRIAAIGCMAGTMSTSDISSCDPSYATPVIHLHGTADGTVPYNSNPLPSLSLVPETMEFWRDIHNCDAAVDSTRYPDLANDGITVDRFVYDNCNPDGSVELWRFNGADHVYLYRPVNDITEMTEIWWFFNKWQHPSPATVGVNENNKEKLTVAPNPSNGLFTITANSAQNCVVTDINGKTLTEIELHVGANNLDINEYPSGVYFMKTEKGTYKLIKN